MQTIFQLWLFIFINICYNDVKIHTQEVIPMQERQESHIISSYFAPRGRKRMYALGMQLAQLYLSPFDKLIGIIGDAGSGKSALIRGMFPNLELTNDDDGLYVRPLPLLDVDEDRGFFSPHSYHVDIRFETGFTQLSDLADAIMTAVHRGKRVVVEHFELVYPLLHGMNADLLIGVGEEVVMTRPTIFGPEPDEIRDMVYQSLPYRLMVHTAEDLCEIFLPEEDLARCGHDDVRHGFVITFPDHPPKIDLKELEEKVFDLIRQDLPVAYVDEDHINVGGNIQPCSSPRLHVSRTGMIQDFHLLYRFIHEPRENKYLLVGCVGERNLDYIRKLNPGQF